MNSPLTYDVDASSLIALVVDDDEPLLTARVATLENHGFLAFGVGTYDDALREFRSVPRVDLVVTDINLKNKEALRGADVSGAILAKELRAISSDLPIYGYSGVFAEGMLSSNMSKPFTAYYPKGVSNPDDINSYAEDWKDAAIHHRDLRLNRARRDLERMKASYHMADRQFETLRDLTPGTGQRQDASSVEEALALAGYRVKLIEPGKLRPKIEGAEALVRGPIVLWIIERPGLAIAEVYGYPELYGDGETEERAITDVLLLMDGYYGDLAGLPAESLGPEILRLRTYLEAVFGAS